MSQPQITGSSDPYAQATVRQQPNQDQTIQHVAELLLAGYTLSQLAAMLAAIIPGISAATFAAIIQSTGGLTGHTAHARLQSVALDAASPGADVARTAARQEIFWRASYIVHAAERLGQDVAAGKSVTEALADEAPNFHRHEAARRGRLDAAARVGRAANMFGDILGWYLNPALNNEPECIAADGHNFRASEGTVLGWPGAVHPRCGCVAGPAHATSVTVNEAVRAARNVVFARQRKYGLRRLG